MATYLDEVIEQLRELPEKEQEAAADALSAFISTNTRDYHLLPHQAEEVRRIRRDLGSGRTRLASDDEIAEVRDRSKL